MGWLVSRIAKEWGIIVGKMKSDIEEQRKTEEDYIYSEVKDQVGRIFTKYEEPDVAYIKIYGITIRKKILHRKSEEYNGADLLLGIEDEKFALIQFKKQNHRNRYVFHKKQLDNLGTFCNFCDQNISIPPQCPSFVWLIDDSGYYTIHRIFRLCEIKKILNGRLSASKAEFFMKSGIFRSSFKELFVKCWVGAKYDRKPTIQQFQDYIVETQRLIVDFNILST